MFRSISTLSILILSAGLGLAGPGHDGGHDHDAGPAATVTEKAPRLESEGETMELVATSQGHTLRMYLDRSDTNEPVSGAQIEVSGEGVEPLQATEIEPGNYAVEADWVDSPGTKALIFTVTAGGEIDLLNGTWTVPDAPQTEVIGAEAVPLTALLTRLDIWGAIIGALALGFVLALAIRRRRPASPSESVPDGPLESTERGLETAVPAPSTLQPRLRSASSVVFAALIIGAVAGTAALAGPGHDHGDGGHGEPAAAISGDVPRKLPDGRVFVPKPTQRLLQVRTQPVSESETERVRELIGVVVSDPASFGQVQAPMDGQIEVSERGMSYVGQKVEKGEVLALLSPAIPVADLGTMQQLRAEVEGKLVIAQQKLARLSRISAVVAQSEIEDTRAELDALREQRRVLEAKDTKKIELRAPVAGVIAVANVRAGQVVTARDTLFEIVDPGKLWVEAISNDTNGTGEIAAAQAVDDKGNSFELAYIGQAPTLRQQARPVMFRVDGGHDELAIGAPVKVLVRSAEKVKGMILPDAAVVRGGSGLMQVWVKESPERYRPIEVRTAPLDGTRTLVSAGLQPGERVVIRGAELINQIR